MLVNGKAQLPAEGGLEDGTEEASGGTEPAAAKIGRESLASPQKRKQRDRDTHGANEMQGSLLPGYWKK